MVSVSVENIKKSYNKTQALRGVSFEVSKGELFGIIGADGAGKSTIFRILTTLILHDSGRAAVEGYDVVSEYVKIREIVGYMPGRFSLYQDLSVEENLKFFATLFNTSVNENYDMIKDIYSYLKPFKSRKAGALSGGMKQKLALCCALIHRPKVLFLDEPTTGVDPVSRKDFWAMLKRLKEEGIAILVSTPYMDEAALCDRIALIDGGMFLRTDTPENIVKNFRREIISVSSSDMHSLLKDLRTIDQAQNCYSFGETHHVIFSEGVNYCDLSQIADYLSQRGHNDIEIKRIEPTIEDCYMLLEGGRHLNKYDK